MVTTIKWMQVQIFILKYYKNVLNNVHLIINHVQYYQERLAQTKYEGIRSGNIT